MIPPFLRPERQALTDWLFPDPNSMSTAGWRVRLVLLVLLLIYGLKVWAMPLTQIPDMLHLTVILFHEAGHIIFAPLGEFMQIAGGSFAQILMPLVCAVALRREGDPFGAGVAVAWMGMSFMDVSVYAFDAAHPVLPLIGGGTGEDSFHDFIWLFERIHQEGHIKAWARVINAMGAVVMFGGFALAAKALLDAKYTQEDIR